MAFNNPALAADFAPVQRETEFRELVEGRDLTRFGIRLQVLREGRITGRGFGVQVGGDWEWRNGYFCRTLEFGDSGDPLNCQLVLRNGNTLRFISDRGEGDFADFRVR
ncbi:MAG: hypothetical protein ACXIVE_06620 [Salinarimonas sp.]